MSFSMSEVLDEFELYLTGSPFFDELIASVGAKTLPSTPEEVYAQVLAEAEESLATVDTPLDAELWGSEMLGILGLPGLAESVVEGVIADAIVPTALSAATPTALAILVVLSVLGSPRLSELAGAARRELLEAEVPEPAWAVGLGSPKVGPCWVSGDYFGEQESVAATFAYGRKRHALCVLIDYNLGGGIKDAYVSGKVPTLRRGMFELAQDNPITFCEEITPADAASRLREARRAPECPRLPDQVEDVTRTRALLRSRLELMLSSQPT